MKNLLIATLLSLALISNAQFLPKDKIIDIFDQNTPLNTPLNNLSAYLQNLGEYFNLDFSDQVSCYNNESALIKLQIPAAIESYSHFYLEGKQTLATAAGLALQKLILSISGAIECQHSTPSYSDFLEKIGLQSNVTSSEVLLKYYYLGEMEWNYVALLPVVAQLAKGQYAQAGKALGPIYEAIGKNASEAKVYRNYVSAFHYGVFFAMNISSPLQFWNCFNQEDKEQNYTLMVTGWAKAVADSSPTTANEATAIWFKEKGQGLMESIQDQVNCEISTSDQTRYNTALGYDVHSELFKRKIVHWCRDHQAQYYFLMKSMNDYIYRREPSTVGYIYSMFMYTVATSSSLTEEDILSWTRVQM